MHPIAYGAVYAASREFFEQHQDWAFYNSVSSLLCLSMCSTS